MALSDTLRALIGQQAEAAAPTTPTPDMTKFIASLMAPMDNTPAPLMKQEERKKSLSGSTKVAPKRTAPLAKKEEVPVMVKKEETAPISIEDMVKKDTTERIADIYQRTAKLRAGALPGQTITEKVYENLVPKKSDFDTAVSQALDLEAAAMPEYTKDVEENKYVQGIGKQLLQEKMASPYRNVDLERMDKLSAALMGAKPLGMKNEPSPQEELISVAKLNQLKQAYDQFKAKEMGDYVSRILTPYNVAGAGFTVPQPQQPRAGGKTPQPKEVRAMEIDKYTDEVQKARDLNAKGKEILAVLDEAKNVPASDLMKHFNLKQKYERLVNEVRTSNKEARGFGAAFSALENKLNSASLPGSYISAVAQRKANAGNRVENLTSFINQANALAEEKSKAAYSAYTRPGEKEHLDIRIGGYKAEAEAGSGANPRPKSIQDILAKAKGGNP